METICSFEAEKLVANVNFEDAETTNELSIYDISTGIKFKPRRFLALFKTYNDGITLDD